MADNLIALDKAAQLLNTTEDELLELRTRGEIHGYRDGASWKFKRDEIKRIAEERGIQIPENDSLSDLDLAIEGSGINLSDSSFGLDGDLGLSSNAGFVDLGDDQPIDLSEEIELVDDDDDVVDLGSDIGSVIDLDEEGEETPELSLDLPDSSIEDMIELADDEVAATPSEEPAATIPPDQGDDIDDLLVDIEDLDVGDDGAGDEVESILVSEEALGHSGETTSSTIIGKRQSLEADSDMELADDIGSSSKVELDSAKAPGEINLVAGGSSVIDTNTPDAEPVDAGTEELEAVDLDGLELSEPEEIAESADSPVDELQVESALDLGDLEEEVAGDDLELDLSSSLELSEPSGTISEEAAKAEESSPETLDFGSDLELSAESGADLVPAVEGLGGDSNVLAGEESEGTSGSDTGKLLADGSDAPSVSDDDLELALDSEMMLGDDEEVELEELEGAGLSDDLDGGSVLDSDGGAGSVDSESALDDFDLEPVGGQGDAAALDDDLALDVGSGDDLALFADEEGSDLVLQEDLSELSMDTGAALDDLGGSTPAGDALDGSFDDDLSLELDDSEVSLDDGAVASTGSDLGSDIALEADDDDLDVMLAGSGMGSDLSLGTDSGINLSPTDSGLSLEEEPLDLGGSSIEQLELPEDDDMISLEDSGQSGVGSQLKADDEFLLTPIEEAEDESSGSQVIALEDSEVYADADAQTMLGAGDAPHALVAADVDMGMGAVAPGMTAQPMAMAAPAPSLPEAKYSIWNVASLMLILLLLALCGTMMVDVMRNIWSSEQPIALTTSLMDWLVETIGFN